MATVLDKSDRILPHGLAKDRAISTPNRIVAVTPVAATLPLYIGEIVQFTSAAGTTFYKATGLTVNDWVLVSYTRLGIVV